MTLITRKFKRFMKRNGEVIKEMKANERQVNNQQLYATNARMQGI